MLGLLMNSVSKTLETMSRKQFGDAMPAYVMVLHTWTQDMAIHPHVHVLMAGGALDADGTRWLNTRRDFLFSTKALSKVFRGIFLSQLFAFANSQEISVPKSRNKWHVYCAPPFRNALVSTKYFARYCNRIALSDRRILHVDTEGQQVTIGYHRDPGEREPRGKGITKIRTSNRRQAFVLSFHDLVTRFANHILPKGFVKIRYGGLYANRTNKRRTSHAQALIAVPTITNNPPQAIRLNRALWNCPTCDHPLVITMSFAYGARSPP